MRERPDDRVAAWVFFTDRAGREHDPAAFDNPRQILSPRSLDRRARRGSIVGLVASDLPVHAPYVHALTARGARLRGVSRWLNAASVEVPARLALELARFPFVSRVELVPRGRPIADPVNEPEGVEPEGMPSRGVAPHSAPAAKLSPGDTAYYGGSFRQLSMMQVPQLHAMGLSGAGVLVCMLDSGFHLTHQAFAGLNVLAKRDFIHGDTNVDYDPLQDAAGQADHGTWTLACVAGSKPGTYSGGAFGATVALAKTEEISTETPVEMDYWQFGAEWADSLGADVISSSLGYSEFDDSTESYSYADMDGRTTVVTLAAVEAVSRGITVVNSAGNSGASAWHYIIAPADADTLIAAGAVDSNNVVTSFSSRGPTADGRIKPNVTAMGLSVLSVSLSNNSTYGRVSGTSFSAPLTAGVVALLLEAHPTWRPYDVREALCLTALNHGSPNNNIGWGLVQGLAARSWTPTADVGSGPKAPGVELSAAPNPVRAGVGAEVRFAAPHASRVTLDLLDLAGRRRARLFDGVVYAPQTVHWNGVADDGTTLPAGVYWIRIAARGGEALGAVERRSSSAVRVVLLP